MEDTFKINPNVVRTQSLPRSNLFTPPKLRPLTPLSRAQIPLQCQCSFGDKFKSNTLNRSSSLRHTTTSARSSSVCSTIVDESLGEVMRKFDEVWYKEKIRTANRSVNSSLSSINGGTNFNTLSSSLSSQRYFITSSTRQMSDRRNVTRAIDYDSMSIDSPSISPSTPKSNQHISCVFHGCTLATDLQHFTRCNDKESPSHLHSSVASHDIDICNSPSSIVNCCSRNRIIPSHLPDCLFAVTDGESEKNKDSSYVIRRNSSWTGHSSPLVRDKCPVHHRLSLMAPSGNRRGTWCNGGSGINCATAGTARAYSIEPGSESSSSDSSTSDSRKSYVLQAPRSTFTSLNSSLGSSFSANGVSRNNSLRRSSTYSVKGSSNCVSVGTETDRVIKRDATLQVLPETFSRGTKTDTVITKNVSTCTRRSTLVHQSIQTDPPKADGMLLIDKCIQVTNDLQCTKQEKSSTDAAVDTSDLPHSVLTPLDSPLISETSDLFTSVDETNNGVDIASEANVTIRKSPAGDEIVMEERPDEIIIYKRPQVSGICLSLPENEKLSDSSRKVNSSSQFHCANRLEKLDTNGNADIYESSSEEDLTNNNDASELQAGERSRDTVCEPSSQSKQAFIIIQEYLEKAKQQQEPAFIANSAIVAKEWFSISSGKDCNSKHIEQYLDAIEGISKLLLDFVVNLSDSSGNTAMHYAISHSNFDAASVLLDSKVCDVNKFNKAGYTALMLVSIAKISNELEKAVVKRLFAIGDVNLKTKDNGQTALMLASSHGKLTTVKLLLDAGADVNIQDKEGSTALMAAADNGHIYVVKLLLCHFETDVNLTDNDGANALSIAMAAGHKNIGLILYTTSNLLNRGTSHYSSLRRSTPTDAAPDSLSLRRTSSFNSTKALTKFSLINGRKQGL